MSDTSSIAKFNVYPQIQCLTIFSLSTQNPTQLHTVNSVKCRAWSKTQKKEEVIGADDKDIGAHIVLIASKSSCNNWWREWRCYPRFESEALSIW